MSEDAPENPGDESPEETVEVGVVAQGAADYLSELEEVVGAADIPCRIIAPTDCDTGCAPRLLLVTRVDDLDAARTALEAHWNQEMSEEERAAAGTVIDLDAEETACPACGTSFSTDATRCPECGLNFGE